MRRRSPFRILLPLPDSVEDLVECLVVVLSPYEVNLLVHVLEYARRRASYGRPVGKDFEEDISDDEFILAKKLAEDLIGELLMAKCLDLSALENLRYLQYLRCLCGSNASIVEASLEGLQENQLEIVDDALVPAIGWCKAVNAAFYTYYKVTEFAKNGGQELADYATTTGLVTGVIMTLLGGGIVPLAITALAVAFVEYGYTILTDLAMNRLVESKEEIICAAYNALVRGEDPSAAVFSVAMERELGVISSTVLKNFFTEKVLRQMLSVEDGRIPQSTFVDCTTCVEHRWCIDQETELNAYRKDIIPAHTVARSEVIEIIGVSLVISHLEARYYVGPPDCCSPYEDCVYVGSGEAGLKFALPAGYAGRQITLVAKGGGTVQRVCFLTD